MLSPLQLTTLQGPCQVSIKKNHVFYQILEEDWSYGHVLRETFGAWGRLRYACKCMRASRRNAKYLHCLSGALGSANEA